MAVLAHPDDESFGMGGTLAWYASQGVEVRLVCATRGEVGEVNSDLLKGFKSVADLRTHELTCAASALGLASVDFLDYRDSGMQGSAENKDARSLFQAPLEQVAERISQLMERYEPQVVVTFDPSGGYLHPDHIKMNRAAELAFFNLQKKPVQHPKPYLPQKLYFHTMPVGMFKYFIKIMPWLGIDPTRFGKNKDIDLTQIVCREYPTHALIDFHSVVEKREMAAACHSSQGGARTTNPVLRFMNRLFGKKDSFMRAYPPPEGGVIEKDLFLGV
jgi:N-acetyl-1-D-myo-inositol-2-amino-2-deoxy-alpha-D-glucopyranoside deacetylase